MSNAVSALNSERHEGFVTVSEAEDNQGVSPWRVPAARRSHRQALIVKNPPRRKPWGIFFCVEGKE